MICLVFLYERGAEGHLELINKVIGQVALVNVKFSGEGGSYLAPRALIFSVCHGAAGLRVTIRILRGAC